MRDIGTTSNQSLRIHANILITPREGPIQLCDAMQALAWHYFACVIGA